MASPLRTMLRRAFETHRCFRCVKISQAIGHRLDSSSPNERADSRTLGAAGVFCIWSGFLVFSRAGMQSGLTPFDLTALRFMVSGALVLPFAKAWWPRHLPLHAILSMSIFGPGALYNILMYFGLKGSSAAYGEHSPTVRCRSSPFCWVCFSYGACRHCGNSLQFSSCSSALCSSAFRACAPAAIVWHRPLRSSSRRQLCSRSTSWA